jgi:hypothetical protein
MDDNTVQEYTNGDPTDCPDGKARKTQLKFACSRSREYISHISEPAVCVYNITVATQLACDNPIFPDVSEMTAR